MAFEIVANLDDLEPGETLFVEDLREPICLVRLDDDDVRAVHNTCTHQQQPLPGLGGGDARDAPHRGIKRTFIRFVKPPCDAGHMAAPPRFAGCLSLERRERAGRCTLRATAPRLSSPPAWLHRLSRA